MRIHMRSFYFSFFLCLVLSWACTSCATRKEMPPPVVEPPPPVVEQAPLPEEAEPQPPVVEQDYVHTVSISGESLSIIAKWYTGDLQNWEKLAEHNPALNPNRIFKGDKIMIPHDLLIREEPLTQEFVDESRRGTKRRHGKGGEQPAIEPVSPNGVPLFGPKDYSR
ncbi:MAG: LysM peptidoglycan-binding domain-containing protein [Deltaproteobacteria bacterium]|nr:LysM peptidoglycan-binding domain-containing protein [Deltaproteobacteria bacterium]